MKRLFKEKEIEKESESEGEEGEEEGGKRNQEKCSYTELHLDFEILLPLFPPPPSLWWDFPVPWDFPHLTWDFFHKTFILRTG